MPTMATKKNPIKKKTTKTSAVRKTASANGTTPKFNSFPTWWKAFSSKCTANPAQFGLTKPQASAFVKFLNSWNGTYAAWQSFQTTWNSKPAVVKTTSRKPATKKTPKAPVHYWNSPTWTPKFNFNWSKKGQCIISFGTNPSSKNNGFAANAKSVCLQFRIGTGAWKTLATTSKTNFTQVVSSPAPKNLQYRACYIAANGHKGPWNSVAPVSGRAAA